MISIKPIAEQAASHHGGMQALQRKLRVPMSLTELRALSNDRWLSELSKVTFQIGFNWSLVDKKWPAFEEQFFGFDIAICASLPDEAIEDAMATGKIIRNWKKLKAIRANAQWMMNLADQHGSVGEYLSELDSRSYFEQLLNMQKGATNVGIRTVQIWLRKLNVDAFVYTPDVERVLKMYGVIDKPPSSKASWLELQKQLNTWMEEGNYSLSNLSQILAFSLGPNG